MADNTLSTVLYIDTDLDYLADSPVEPPLPIALVVIGELLTDHSLPFFAHPNYSFLHHQQNCISIKSMVSLSQKERPTKSEEAIKGKHSAYPND